MAEVIPTLFFEREAEEAARFYVSVIPGSSIDAVTPAPGGEETMIVDFTIAGAKVVAMNGRQGDGFTDATSLLISCDDQAEIDRIWDGLSADGSPGKCGWIVDRYGVRWQITHPRLLEMFSDPDLVRVERVMGAFMEMTKIDLAGLEAAFEG